LITPRITDLERSYVDEVFATDFRSSAGSEMVGRLERAFAEALGSRFVISFVNGTATLHAALVAAGVGAGDEVIVPPLTMSSTAFAVVQAGAEPVFADVDAKTFTLDPRSVEKKVCTRTKAVIPVALYGLSADMDPLMALAESHGLFVLEDAAQCFGGQYHGRQVGTLGHASSFSLQSSKQLTAGEGGLVATNDEALANEVRRFGSLGYRAVAAGAGKITKDTIQHPSYLRHASIGFNYRMPELCAAVALAQVERMEELLAVRLHAGRLFHAAVDGCDWLIPQAVPDGYVHSYWTYALQLAPDCGVSWERFRAVFLENGGEPFYGAWQLSYLEPVFEGQRLFTEQNQEYRRGLCPVAEALQPRLIQLPTNYFDEHEAEQQASALRKTIVAISR
jgi:perosamine synthetase